MATTKITITLPDDLLGEIRKSVSAKKAPGVSRFIRRAVEKSLHDAAEFREIIDRALEETGGPLTKKEQAWARRILTPARRGGKPRRIA